MKLIILLLSIILTNPALAMRCGDKLVYEGDSEYDVKTKCGEPLDKETYQLSTPQYTEQGGKVGDATSTIDKWYYQSSPADFQYELIFDGGVLKTINANRHP